MNRQVLLPPQTEREIIRITTHAFVLRRVRWSESSLILTLYSLDFGRISAIAKGALRSKSAFFGSMELFSLVEFSLSRKSGRELDTVTDTSVINYFESIREDPEAFVHSCLFAEWLLVSISGSEPSHPMFHLIGSVLNNFAAGTPFWPILCSGIEKALRLSGFAMEINRCTKCGKSPVNSCMWDAASGGIVCDDCDEQAKPVPRGFIEFIRKSRSGNLEKIRKLQLWPGGYRQCLELMRDFAEIHLETKLRLKSLSVLEDLENDH
ncbi:MAG: DNA repair protein RecO [Candidatus Aegiribacteria sp.]|nr:DNA repair protein RecO [Candidatus Aegiribacteria sp.]